jgi:hypothetical protein
VKYLHKIVSGFFLASLPIICGISGSIPLSTMLKQADNVVVATISGSSATGTVTVDLTVQRVVKGSLPILSTVSAEVAQSSTSSSLLAQATSALSTGKTGLWFLQQVGSAWRILPLVSGDTLPSDLYIPVPSADLPTAYTYDAGADPKKKLRLEIEAAAVNPTTAMAISKVASRRMLDDGLGADILQSLNANLASSSQSIPKAIGLAGQMQAGQPSAITTLVALPLSTLPSDVQALLARSVCDYRGTNPAAIAGLTTLSESASSPVIERCAAHALREIHTKETLPALEHLLDSPISAVRYDAVIGIAQFAMKFPVAKAGQKFAAMANFTPDKDVTEEMSANYPGMDVFAENEGQYISYWKDWLSSHMTQ